MSCWLSRALFLGGLLGACGGSGGGNPSSREPNEQSDQAGQPGDNIEEEEVSGVGPSSGQTGSIEPVMGAEVYLSPQVMTTAVGSSPVFLLEVVHPTVSTEEVTKAVSGQMVLESDSGDVIQLGIEAEPLSEYRVRFHLAPERELESTWFTLIFRIPAFLDAQNQGELRVPLHPDSAPGVAMLEVCWKDPTTASALVYFSEPVTWNGEPGEGLSLEFTDASLEGCSGPAEVLTESSLGVNCSDVSQSSPISLTLSAGALTGVQNTNEAQAFSPNSKDWFASDDDCTAVRFQR